MLIEEYLAQIKRIIAQSYFILDAHVSFDKRSLYIAVIEGRLTFFDNSELHLMEFVNVKTKKDKYKYSYHYQDKTGSLIFRYDMAPHHKNIPTFPHHKHTADGKVIEAELPDLSSILDEIEQYMM